MSTPHDQAPKPRVHFCWECGKLLKGNYFTEMMVERHMRILHKGCAENIQNGVRFEEFYTSEPKEDQPPRHRR